MFARRPLLLTAAFLALLFFSPLRAAEWLLSFEAGVPAGESAQYTARATLTTELVAELGPAILDALGLDASTFDAEVAPGGYRGRINPSVLLILDGERPAAERAAAALAFVFEQESVLMWRDGDTGTLAVAVEFPSLTPNLVEFFFRQAAAVHPGLAGGFTARGQRLIFINLRGSDGRPLSGLDDDSFAAALRRAAQSFGVPEVSTGRVDAFLVDGTTASTPILERLRARRRELLGAAR